MRSVGPKANKLLKKLSLITLGDIIYHTPSKYIDFSNIKTINSVKIDEEVTVFGEVISCKANNYSKVSTIICMIKDGTSVLPAVWFNQPYLANTLKAGTKVFLSGCLSKKFGRLQMENPIYEVNDSESDLTHTGRIIPVHPSTTGLAKRQLRTIIKMAINNVCDIEDPLHMCKPANIQGLYDAFKKVHFPETADDPVDAINRFAWEELFYFFLLQKIKKGKNSKVAGIAHENKAIPAKAIAGLPFSLTDQQEKCIKSIFFDMETPFAMDRVIQGDVGSGKTIVAFLAMLKAVASGGQAVLMAPTEILAEQHYKRFNEFFAYMDINNILLTGSTSQKLRKQYLNSVKSAEAQVIIGTHALIQESIEYRNLSLVVIDEQHRFGVVQREKLRQKSHIIPDYLMLSATPIPRTMFSITYADVDVNIIDEFPASTRDVSTKVVPVTEENLVIDKVKTLIATGRQTFIVCPVIEDGDALQLQAVEKELTRWAKALYPYRIGKMHGKMSSRDKQSVMEDFSRGFLDVLICTSVIEVGIDVPNATIMVINNADRFGLAQLHQMRGRIGRGGDKSYCFLMCSSNSAASSQRLKALEQHNDGFKLSEIDLQLRGEGEIFGLKQWGRNQFKFVDFTKHTNYIKETRKAAEGVCADFHNDSQSIAAELRRRYPMYKELIKEFANNSRQVQR